MNLVKLKDLVRYCWRHLLPLQLENKSYLALYLSNGQ